MLDVIAITFMIASFGDFAYKNYPGAIYLTLVAIVCVLVVNRYRGLSEE